MYKKIQVVKMALESNWIIKQLYIGFLNSSLSLEYLALIILKLLMFLQIGY